MTREQAITICQDLNQSIESGYIYSVKEIPTDFFAVMLTSYKVMDGVPQRLDTIIEEAVFSMSEDRRDDALRVMRNLHRLRWAAGGKVIRNTYVND